MCSILETREVRRIYLLVSFLRCDRLSQYKSETHHKFSVLLPKYFSLYLLSPTQRHTLIAIQGKNCQDINPIVKKLVTLVSYCVVLLSLYGCIEYILKR